MGNEKRNGDSPPTKLCAVLDVLMRGQDVLLDQSVASRDLMEKIVNNNHQTIVHLGNLVDVVHSLFSRVKDLERELAELRDRDAG